MFTLKIQPFSVSIQCMVGSYMVFSCLELMGLQSMDYDHGAIAPFGSWILVSSLEFL